VSKFLSQKTLAYLQSHNVLSLATSGPEDLWAAAVFYVNSDFTLYFLSDPFTRHSKNIAANPIVAATIQEDYRDWPEIKGIQLEGQAFQIQGVEKIAAIANFGAKFPIIENLSRKPAEIAKAMSKINWYKLEPQHLYFIDNSLGLGHRDKVL